MTIEYPKDPLSDLVETRAAYYRAKLVTLCRPVPSGCWEVISWGVGSGRPKILLGKRSVLAARASYDLFNGRIPEGASVCHSCDNPLCVNPNHLWLGTHIENMRDKVAKGRARGGGLGEKNVGAVLNDEQVGVIKRDLLNGAKQADIARLYGVGATTISGIATGARWKHIAPAPHSN